MIVNQTYDANSNTTSTSFVSNTDSVVIDTPQKVSETRMTLRHRQAFNLRMFPHLFEEDETLLPITEHPNSSMTSSEMSQAEWQEAIDIVRFMGPAKLKDANDAQVRYRSQLSKVTVRNWTRLIHGIPKIECYKVEEYFHPGSDQVQYRLLRKYKRSGWNEPKWLICVPQLKVFDAILDSHSMVSHLRQNQTCALVHEKYFNVSEKHVKTFIDLCEVCNHSNPVKKPEKGAKKPILSKHFRDRFQVDLIDMQTRAMKDEYGNLMKWIMTLKDHFTQLTYLVPLPRKKASHVAYELDRIFGLIGYPSIFHTDNGTEFIAHEILVLLRKYNSAIMTVTGRPRTPRDQGSVESMNKLVKRVIEKLENEDRLQGIEPNWTRLLGRCMQTINAKKGRELHDVSPYMAVFGQPFHPDIKCEQHILRQCTTIEERLKVSEDDRLKEVAEETCILGETDISCKPDMQYWDNDDSIAAAPKLDRFEIESNVESNITSDLQAEFDIQTNADINTTESNVDSVVMSDLQAEFDIQTNADIITIESNVDSVVMSDLQAEFDIQTNADIKTNDIGSDQYHINDIQKSIKIESNQQKRQSKRRNTSHITLKEAKERRRNKVLDLYKRTDNNDPYCFIWPRLQCKTCSNGNGDVVIKVGDEQYLNDMGHGNKWYDIMLVNSFGFLCYHSAHTQKTSDGLKFVLCDMPKQEVVSTQLVRVETEKVLVSVFHGNSHYVVATIDLENQSVSIFDGLRYRPGLWTEHVRNVLIRYQLVSITGMCKVLVSDAKYSVIEFVDQSVDVSKKWTVRLDNAFVKQRDSFSCGPIACLKLFELFVDKDILQGLDAKTYRHNVIQRFDSMLERYDENLLVPIPGKSVISPPNDMKSPTIELDKTPLRQADSDRKLATSSKRKRQDSQAKRMIKYGNAKKNKVSVGAVVTVSLDKRDFYTNTGVRAIVFDVKEGTGAILACSEAGIISQRNGHHFWIPSDRYGVTSASDENAALTDALTNIRNQVLNGTFQVTSQQRVTLVQAQKQFMGRSPRKKGSCQCKDGRCTRRCGCRRNGKIKCSSSCSCSGNCNIQLQELGKV